MSDITCDGDTIYQRIRIVCEDGTANTVRIFDATGREIEWGKTGWAGIVIDPIKPGGMVTVRLALIGCRLDYTARLDLLPPRPVLFMDDDPPA